MEKLVDKILKRFESAKRMRTQYETVWKDLTKYFMPYKADFDASQQTKGRSANTDLYNSEGANSASILASTISSGLFNYATRWAQFTITGDLRDNIRVRQFLEAVDDAVFSAIYDSDSNFVNQSNEFIHELIVYGTACMYIEAAQEGLGVNFVTRPLSEIYILENYLGRVDTVFRRFRMPARNIAQRWDDLPEEIIKILQTDPDKLVDCLHAVFPRNEPKQTGFVPATKKAYASFYVLLNERYILSESGYDYMPYIISRLMRRPEEVYGVSPAWIALPDAKMANKMAKTLLEVSEKIANPPILMTDDGVITQMRLVPGQPVIGGIDSTNYQQRMQPWTIQGNIPVNLEMLKKVEGSIRNRFFVDFLSMNQNGTEKTATEVVEIKRESARMMSPQIGRLQTEMLTPIVETVKMILSQQGMIPVGPKELMGVRVDLDFTSPLAKLQHADGVDAITRTMQLAVPLMNVDPNLMDSFDTDAMLKYIAETNGVPPKVMRTEEEVAAVRNQRAQAQQAAQMAEMMAQSAGAIKDTAQAGLYSSQIGQ